MPDPQLEPQPADVRHRRRERVLLAAGRRAIFAGRALALSVGFLCAANGGSQSCPDSEQGCTWQWRDGKAGPSDISSCSGCWSSCVRNISGVSCAANNPGPECCTNGTQCLQTAKAACVADYRCRAVAFDTRDGWGARLYGLYYTPETLFGWEMYIKVCPGCTDRLATNFAPVATEDDGSCTYIEGCLDTDNANYNPAAGRDTTPSSCACELNFTVLLLAFFVWAWVKYVCDQHGVESRGERGGIFGYIHRGKTLQLHRTHGQTVDGRCIARWSVVSGGNAHGDSGTTTVRFNRIAFCVPMPNPTATAAFFQVTKEVQDLDRNQWAEEGDVVKMSHIMSVTGNPRSAILESDMHREGWRALRLVFEILVGTVFIFFFIVTLFVGTFGENLKRLCGQLALLICLPIFVGVPVWSNHRCAKKEQMMRNEPDGDAVEVNEQAVTNLLTMPVMPSGMADGGTDGGAAASATPATPFPAPVATTSTANPVAGEQPIRD